MEELETRIRMAAESILENETIAEGLDELAGSALLEWGVTCAKQIAREAEGEDDEEIEEAMYPRMRALRKLLNAAKNFARADAAQRLTLLDELLTPASSVYADKFFRPNPAAMQELVKDTQLGQQETITQVRNLFENRSQGENIDV